MCIKVVWNGLLSPHTNCSSCSNELEDKEAFPLKSIPLVGVTMLTGRAHELVTDCMFKRLYVNISAVQIQYARAVEK